MPGMDAPTKGMELRCLTSADLHAFAELVAQHRMFLDYGLTPHALATDLSQAIDAGHKVFGASITGRAAGLAWLVPRGAFDRSAYLRLLIVSVEAQGTGVAERLMGAVEARAFQDSNDVFLLVNETNLRAMRFYARRGYVTVGKIPGYTGPGRDEVICRLRRPDAGAVR